MRFFTFSRYLKPRHISILLITLLFPFCSTAASKQELQGVKNEISRQQQSLDSQTKQLDNLQNTLKGQELEIVSLEKQISQTQIQLKRSTHNLNQLKERMTALAQQQKAQSERLKQLLHTYYITRQSNHLSGLLKDDADEDRMSQYYQHLAKARSEMINQLEQTKQQLHQHEQQLTQEQAQIQSLLSQQTQKRNQLQQTQRDRKNTVNKIRSRISSDKNYLAELQRNESRLKAEIAKAAKRNQVPMDGFSRQRGKLPWPIQGKLLHRFGTHQTGQINWKGIVINAAYGQPVKAVYPGSVVFSDYLRGYGLVVLIDHGQGDMTLYGFNQTLLKKEGDKVTAGETIALAGDTGGQPVPSLYFEVRRNSKASNPLRWLQ
ncbi:murein hydrolase activator EnvC family protein [Vibrio rhizosphaerae]|uniref:murein hydrolase activator EnvC family protein n=1 Tax=Vibrio rhizosphaerae TaxID=398736 RepID=UPI001FE1F573|nr:murein hydrolase activator EnvC [Vibrio rhizosphaerae]